jgi:hypothetical protein
LDVGLVDTNLTTDQRGFERQFGTAPDLGSVERRLGPTITVVNNADSGPGSLRQAIFDAEFEASVFFDAGLSGQTIALNSGRLEIERSMTVDASSLVKAVVIDASANSPNDNCIRINEGEVTLEGLVIRGAGSGIFNRGSLTLNRSTITDNTAGTYFGGGISNIGAATINNCTIVGNSATEGGGISNSGTLQINNSTISKNSAGSGGGIITRSSLTLRNSVVAVNAATTSGWGPDLFKFGGSVLVAPEGVNLLSDLANSGLSAGSSIIVANPLLGVLGDYGGPIPVMRPLSGSPLIDAALADAAITADQRGFSRPFGTAPDIGAVEVSENDFYSGWIANSGLLSATGFNEDGDGDGVPNGVEDFLGTDPNEFSQALEVVSAGNGSFTFTHPKNKAPSLDVTADYRWSTDINQFYAPGETGPNGETVEFVMSDDTPSTGVTTVTATFSSTPIPEKFFVIIEAIQE